MLEPIGKPKAEEMNSIPEALAVLLQHNGAEHFNRWRKSKRSFPQLPEADLAGKLLAGVKGKTWTAEDNTLYLRLEKAYFEPATLIALLRKILCKNA